MPSDAEHLQGILDAIKRVGRYLGTGERAAFDASEVVRDAVTYRVAMIGEAASRLSPAVRAQAPDVQCQKIIRMRNIIVHDYLAVDHGVVCEVEVATTKLDELRVSVETLLGSELL